MGKPRKPRAICARSGLFLDALQMAPLVIGGLRRQIGQMAGIGPIDDFEVFRRRGIGDADPVEARVGDLALAWPVQPKRASGAPDHVEHAPVRHHQHAPA